MRLDVSSLHSDLVKTEDKAMSSRPPNHPQRGVASNEVAQHRARPPQTQPQNSRVPNPNSQLLSSVHLHYSAALSSKKSELDALVAEYLAVAEEQQRRRVRIEALMVQTEAEMDARLHSIAEEKKALRSSFSELRKQLFREEDVYASGDHGKIGDQAVIRGLVDAEYPGRGRTSAIVPLSMGRGGQGPGRRVVNGTRPGRPEDEPISQPKHSQSRPHQQRMEPPLIKPGPKREVEEEDDSSSGSGDLNPLGAPPRPTTSSPSHQASLKPAPVAQVQPRPLKHPALPPNRNFFPERPLLTITPSPRKSNHAAGDWVAPTGAISRAGAKKGKEGAPRYQPY